MSHLLLRASFCVQARTDWISSLYSMPVDGAPTLSLSQAQELLVDGPLSVCATTDERVLMLPSGSVREAWWLALTSMRILQTDASKLRRQVVEAGATCGEANYSASRAIFLLDCSAAPPYHTRPCDGGPSIPFRRVAHRILRVDALNATALAYGVEEDATLHDPDANSNVEFGLSILKLALLVLTAAVVFTRSRRETSSNALIFVDAYVVSRDGAPLIAGTTSFKDVLEDGILGGLTILGRVVVVFWKGPGLVSDGHTRIVVLQSIAAAVAFVHFVLRYAVEYMYRRQRSPPALWRLDGDRGRDVGRHPVVCRRAAAVVELRTLRWERAAVDRDAVGQRLAAAVRVCHLLVRLASRHRETMVQADAGRVHRPLDGAGHLGGRAAGRRLRLSRRLPPRPCARRLVCRLRGGGGGGGAGSVGHRAHPDYASRLRGD